MKYEWSTYQKAIFQEIESGKGHVAIIARAGSAKTTSIVEGCKYIPKGKKVLFCAFNKSIQEELKNKLPKYAEALTLHSLGFRGLRNKFGNVIIDKLKCWKIIESFFDNPKENYDLIENIDKTVSACKATLTDTPSKIEELIEDYDIDTCETNINEFIGYVVKALRLCKEQTNAVDFNDMIWMCFVHRIIPGKFDYVFIDEAHDMSRAQIELALSAIKSDGRVFVVLDPDQNVYSWRHADINLLDNVRQRLNAKELFLPICYRCPTKVVNLAKNLVPDIIAYDKSPAGEIIRISYEDLLKHIKPGSYLISRVNAPLIKWCLILLKNGIPANILGRDIGDSLLYLIKKSRKKSVKEFLKWIDNWAKDEKEKLLDKNPKANIDIISDKVECLYNLSEGAKSLDDMKKNIENLFKENDEKKIVLGSSVHRIKGKEQDDVFVLEDTLRYPLYKTSHKNEFNEERNIAYVAITRSRKRLFLVNKKKEDINQTNWEDPE